MYRFWDSLIEPLLARAQARVVVEVGAYRGWHTRRLAGWAQRAGAVLHVIDPAPELDAAAFAATYGQHFVLHRCPSLNALPQVNAPDVVLLDGDHNYYTVYHELRQLETLAAERGQAFPIVALHDVGWPFARRDLYYDPDSIPAAWRRPSRRAGAVPEQTDLVPAGGLNAHLLMAVSQGGPRNGVLTAVDDFRRDTPVAHTFLQVPGFHGLGLLLSAQRQQLNPALAEWSQRLGARFAAAPELGRLEARRLRLEMAAHEWERRRANPRRRPLATLARRWVRARERLVAWQIAAEHRRY